MNPRKTLIIHVGAPKTGTTAIQNELFANRSYLLSAHGILYPTAGVKKGQRGHHNLVYEIAPAHRNAGKFDQSRGGWRRVLQEIERLDAHTAVVSAEGLLRRPRQISKSLRIFRDFEIVIAIYLRRQDEYLESGYNQLARFARVEDGFETFIVRRAKIIDYRAIIENWQQYLPSARIVCTPFERRTIGGNVVADFTQRVLGIQDFPTKAATSNIRAGLKSIQAARFVKARVSERLGTDYAISAQVAAQIRWLFTERFPDIYDFSFASLEVARRILIDAEPTNRWLAKRFPGFDPEFFFSSKLDEGKLSSPYRDVAFAAEESGELEAIADLVARSAAAPSISQPLAPTE